MIAKKSKSRFFNIVVIALAVCLFMIGAYFLQSNKFGSNEGDKVYASGEYNFTLRIDSNFTAFYVNGESVTPGTTRVFQFESGQNISFQYTLQDGYNIKQFLSSNTDTSAPFTDVSVSGFTMPSFNVTIDITSVQMKNIIINKVVYENINLYNTYSSLYSTEYGSTLSITVSAEINYEEYEVGGKKFNSHNSFNNITYENSILTISNIASDDEIDVFFIKKSYSCSVIYYEEDSSTNNGGTFDVKSDNNVFNIQKDGAQITCNIFLDAYVTINNITPNAGYRFVKIFATDKNGHSEGVGFNIIENIEENEVTVSGITTELLIYVQFVKIYTVTLSVGNLYINGVQTKVGKIGFFNESKDYSLEPRLVDTNTNIEVSTEIDTIYSDKYEFKRWTVTTPAGMALNIENYNLTEEDLIRPSISLSNIDRSIKVEAIYGVRSFNVSVVWEGNGSVEAVDIIGTNYVYPVVYGESITLKLIPKNNMHLIKSSELKTSSVSGEGENVVTRTQKNGYLEFKIENVLQNLQVKVVYIKNTWWEHIDTEILQGKGTEKEPYKIYTASDLALISKNIYDETPSWGEGYVAYNEAYYVLMNDIDCGKEYYFMPLGILLDKLAQTKRNEFNGTFDYQYHTILNMWTEEDVTTYSYDGLFELLGSDARIINRFKDYKPMIFAIGGGIIGFAIILRLVFFIEKRRNKPKKIVTLNNYNNSDLFK